MRTQFSGKTLQAYSTRPRHEDVLLATPGGAPNDVRDPVWLDRTSGTRKWGVSDPPRSERGTGIGGSRGGSLTSHLPLRSVTTDTLSMTRAAQSAARFNVAKSLTAKDIEKSTCPAARCFCRIRARAVREGGGTLLLSLRSPLSRARPTIERHQGG